MMSRTHETGRQPAEEAIPGQLARSSSSSEMCCSGREQPNPSGEACFAHVRRGSSRTPAHQPSRVGNTGLVHSAGFYPSLLPDTRFVNVSEQWRVARNCVEYCRGRTISNPFMVRAQRLDAPSRIRPGPAWHFGPVCAPLIPPAASLNRVRKCALRYHARQYDGMFSSLVGVGLEVSAV